MPGRWVGSSERTIWVSPDGLDLPWRGVGSAPFRSIQHALDRARPGDEIRLLPGVYRERIRIRRGGVSGRPLRLVADVPGTVTISGYAEPEIARELIWASLGEGIYRANPPWPVYQLRIDGSHAFFARWGDLSALRALARRENAFDAFVWDAAAGHLYLFIEGGKAPSSVHVDINGPVPSPREWGNIRSANVRVEHGHVVIEGLRLEGGVGAGVHAWAAEDVQVRETLIEGATFGVNALPSLCAPRRLQVERTLYHNYPQADWRRSGWLDWKQVYANYSSATLVASPDPGVVVSESIVAHFGDGVRLSPGQQSTAPGARVSRSLFYAGTDDALEIDGAGRDVTFHGNLVFDTHESLSFSPVTRGPVRVEQNLFLHPVAGLNGASLKFLPPMNLADRSVRNVQVRQNLFVGNWLSWHQVPVVDSALEANTLVMQRTQDPPLPEGLHLAANRFVRRDELEVDPIHDAETWRPPWWRGIAAGPSWLGTSGLPFLPEMKAAIPSTWLETADAH